MIAVKILLSIVAVGFLLFVVWGLLSIQVLTGVFTRLPSPEERLAEFQRSRPALESIVNNDTVRHSTKTGEYKSKDLNEIMIIRLFGKPGHRQVEFTVRTTFGWGQYYLWCEDGKPPSQLNERPISNFHDVRILPWGEEWYDVYMNNGH